jgi:translation initiation factor 4E
VLPVSRPTKRTLTEGTKGKLHSSWTLYYHSPASTDWTMDSYTKVHTVHSVQSFCELFFWMDQQIHHLHTGMFFLMRDDIMPTWEDPHNRKGGCWSFKVPMHDVGPLWNQLSVRLVGERLSTTPLLLNGISLSPKRGFCIIKVWNHSSTENRASLLRVKDIPKLQNGGEALYTSFREKK